MSDAEPSVKKKNELLNFGISFGSILAFWGVVFLWRKSSFTSYFFGCSALFLLLGLIRFPLLIPLRASWIRVSYILGQVVKTIILYFLFFGVLFPTGLVARVFGKQFLDLKFHDSQSSYWIKRKTAASEKKQYENQF